MSSGYPEGPSTNPDDWKSPYGTGPGQSPGYGRPAGDTQPAGYGQPSGHDPYARPSGYDPSSGYGQPSGHAPYGQSPGHDPSSGHGQRPYGYEQPQQGYPAPHNQTGGYPADYGRGYGEPGVYDQPYHGQGYAPGHPPQHGDEGTRTHAIVALVISIIMALSCFVSFGGTVGVILSAIALGKVDTDVRTARSLLKWTWISIAANVALLVLGILGIVFLGISSASV
ncbi:hypothetical protein FHS43_006061 [Streptosporangium becharense]|uniref:DUF4190 domain-containing protein n=1 Tax=Streptosporangium becharense TaxID=1816182 RepID=A0A7W9II53_9ACTN|nr:DUF4190 domain-containing protein [Streptosporangium becharense]MBB2914749.1 hypothetical protein [Streptosporangium becharense]MBB5820850.1 hypothetical protein [Streptosporangium becharense]